MSGCNNDKIRSFLTKPKARLRAKYDKLQQAENDRANIYTGTTIFKAKIIGVPRSIGAGVITADGGETAKYVSTVQVMLSGISKSLPDPANAEDANEAVTVINSHTNCFVPQELSSAITVGDEVYVQFDKPYNLDTSQMPAIISKISSDTAYADKLKNVFGGGEFLAAAFQTGDVTTVSQEFLDGARTRPYLAAGGGGSVIITNGAILPKYLNYVKDFNGNNITAAGQMVKNADGDIILYYSSSDSRGGLAFIKTTTGVNYADKLVEMATDYHAAGHGILYITSAFRSLEKQVQLYQQLAAGRAAVPGRSNHGWGLAFDWAFEGQVGDVQFTDEQYLWMDANAYKYGFWNAGKLFLLKREPWHFEIRQKQVNKTYGKIIK